MQDHNYTGLLGQCHRIQHFRKDPCRVQLFVENLGSTLHWLPALKPLLNFITLLPILSLLKWILLKVKNKNLLLYFGGNVYLLYMSMHIHIFEKSVNIYAVIKVLK